MFFKQKEQSRRELSQKELSELDYMQRMEWAEWWARHYGIGQFRHLPGKKSKSAARAGIVKVREKKWKDIGRDERREKRNEKMNNILAALDNLSFDF